MIGQRKIWFASGAVVCVFGAYAVLEWWASTSAGSGQAVLSRIAEVKAAPALPRVLRVETFARCETPEHAREVVAFCRKAQREHLGELRVMAFRSEDPLVAGNAIQALGRLGEARGERFRMLIGDERPRVRHETVRALERSRDRGAVEHLIRALDGDHTMAALAASGLGRLGGERAEKALREMASGADTVLKTFALDALDALDALERIDDESRRLAAARR